MSAPPNEPLHPSLPNGLRLGAPFGITLRLHWSFLLLGAWLGLSTFGQTGSVTALLSFFLLGAIVFGSVALHEYGHALTARRYGIGTREITLLPIGGIAQLEGSPANPRHEFWIALAGPAVNLALVVIVLALYPVVEGDPSSPPGPGESVLGFALYVNLFMGLFNLLPALPMDGGRILRALLALRMPALRATQISATIARLLAAAMMGYGLIQGQLMLAVIGGFVWITAGAEKHRMELEAEMRRRVRRTRADPPLNTRPAEDWENPDRDDPLKNARVVGRGATPRR
ncbi:MAG: site-2 protease family protein [Myxococcota bacterium]|nr:site-2 protease family protein [Myxococcota bacterium]